MYSRINKNKGGIVSMTEMEAKGFIHGKLDCMNECGVFNRADIKKKRFM